jgi:hypothetical protein
MENITPGTRQVRSHHLLHPHRQSHLRVVEPVVHTVDDGAVREERGVAASHGVEEHRFAVNVQECLLLAGEAGVWKVLCRRAAAHGDVAVAAILLLEPSISVANGLNELGGQRRGQHCGSDVDARALERVDVANVEIQKGVPNDSFEIGAAEKGTIRVGGRGKPVRRPNPERSQRTSHLTERRILAANRCDIGHDDVIEGSDPDHRAFSLCLPVRTWSGR